MSDRAAIGLQPGIIQATSITPRDELQTLIRWPHLILDLAFKQRDAGWRI